MEITYINEFVFWLQGRRYSMILLVPLYKDGLEALIRDVPYVGLPTILDQMRPREVVLSMPRFTVNYNEDLVEALTKVSVLSLFRYIMHIYENS